MSNLSTYSHQLLNLRHRQQLLYILLFSFATILVWVVVSLVTSQQSTQISRDQQNMAKPLNPSINRTVIDTLSRKRSYSASELQRFPIYKVILTQDGIEQTVPLDTPEVDTSLPPRPTTPSPTPSTSSSAIAPPVASPPTNSTASDAANLQ